MHLYGDGSGLAKGPRRHYRSVLVQTRPSAGRASQDEFLSKQMNGSLCRTRSSCRPLCTSMSHSCVPGMTIIKFLKINIRCKRSTTE